MDYLKLIWYTRLYWFISYKPSVYICMRPTYVCKPSCPLCMHVCVHVSHMCLLFCLYVCKFASIVCWSVRVYKSVRSYITLHTCVCLFICVRVRSRLTCVFSCVGRFNHSQAANINKFIYNIGKAFGLPLSMPPKSDLNLRRFALELGVPVVKYTLRTSRLEE
jgi:hypothetical protein